MFLALFAVAALHGPSIAELETLTKARDVDGLSKYLAPLAPGERNPFAVIRTGGAYGVGRFGWTAIDLPNVSADEGYVVFSTPLTVEDIGELLFQRQGNQLKFIPEADTMGSRIVSHDFRVEFKTSEKRVDIRDTLSLRSEKSGAPVIFRMAPAYRVQSIQDKAGNSLAFHQGGGVVLFEAPASGSYQCVVNYGGEINLPGYAGSVSEKEATLTDDYWYPMIGRKPAPYKEEVHAPSGWTIIGQGNRVSLDTTAKETVAKFDMELPVTFYSLSAGPYKSVTIKDGGRDYSAWGIRLSEERLRAIAERYPAIVKFFEKFAPYPFHGYGAVESPAYGGGALEAYSFATFGDDVIGSQVHELSHTWWGGIIDNTYLKSFWNESFADFSDGLYKRNVDVGNREEERIAFIDEGQAQPDYDEAAMLDAGADIGPVASSLGYGKGAAVLQMLEQLIGTDKMIAAMHLWIQQNPKGENGDWDGFIKAAEQVAPEADLASFFDDWMARPGYAKFSAAASYDGNATVIDLNWKGPRFRMPLDVMLQFKDGHRIFKTFDTKDGDRIAIPGAKPDIVSVDPYRRALRIIAENESPIEINGATTTAKYVDPKHQDWMANYRGEAQPYEDGKSLDGAFVVGSPESMPVMKPLCDQVGFVVKGNTLTYKGTSIDLAHACALAVVDLPSGGRCVIGLGKFRVAPDLGHARLALADDLGRFLRGLTEPKTAGNLTFRL